MWRIFYNIIIIPLFLLFYRISLPFNSKAREGLKGRKRLFDRIRVGGAQELPIVWFHCASVGEFEQTRPIIKALEGKIRVVISFFSPSGYNGAAKFQDADLICYIPFDTARNARKMLSLIKPDLLVFIRFDVWPNHVWTAAKMGIPMMVADASLQAKSGRLWPIARSFLKSVHKHIDLHCAISEADAQRLKRICPKGARIEVMGDTRFDQVIARKDVAGKKLAGLLPEFQLPVVIAGSTYIEDEQIVIDAYQKILERWGKIQLILVPHDPEPENLAAIEELLSQKDIPYVFLSQIDAGSKLGDKIVVVDRVGVLAELYMLGDITFIGGSFHGSVHNVMEPAIMGKPVLFGPTIHNSLEAEMLRESNAGIMIMNGEELAAEIIKLLDNNQLLRELGATAKALIEENAGATGEIVSCVSEFLN